MPRDEKSASIEAPAAHCDAELVGSGEPVLHPAATLITHGATLYGFSVFSPGPSFPAAKTTAIPASCTALVATLVGSLGSKAPVVPHELFTTLMLYFAALSISQSKAASAQSTAMVSPVLMPIRLAPGATPGD